MIQTVGVEDSPAVEEDQRSIPSSPRSAIRERLTADAAGTGSPYEVSFSNTGDRLSEQPAQVVVSALPLSPLPDQ